MQHFLHNLQENYGVSEDKKRSVFDALCDIGAQRALELSQNSGETVLEHLWSAIALRRNVIALLSGSDVFPVTFKPALEDIAEVDNDLRWKQLQYTLKATQLILLQKFQNVPPMLLQKQLDGGENTLEAFIEDWIKKDKYHLMEIAALAQY